MLRVFTALTLMVCLCSSAIAGLGQKNSKNNTKSNALPKNAINNSTQLQTEMNVSANVTAEAVLIPRTDVTRIFGKEIANNYAVIQLIVGNKSSDAALIVHGIFIDYTRWALSGFKPGPSVSIDGVNRDKADKFQASTDSHQIASEEYRVVRGQLLDAQTRSARNWIVRALTLAGSIAGAYAFSLREQGFVRGIASFNGTIVPGVQTLWPDGTVEQLNRVSDFGYKANTVIPQKGSEVIVCFFPIDRFLSPGFRQLFLQSPALFFSPFQMLFDNTMKPAVAAVLGKDFGFGKANDVDTLANLLPCYKAISALRFAAHPSDSVRQASTQSDPNGGAVATDSDSSPIQNRSSVDILSHPTEEACLEEFGLMKDDKLGIVLKDKEAATIEKFKRFLVLDFISEMSLNNVKVVVDGVMTVDTTSIAAKIDGVQFDKLDNCGDDHNLCFWGDPSIADGVRTGSINGAYLTGGELRVAEATALGIKVDTITEGSTDQLLHFSLKLNKAIPFGKSLHFIVGKTQSPGTTGSKTAKTLDSPQWEYVVGYPIAGPTVSKVEIDSAQSKVTITGTEFVDTPDNPLVVTLHKPDGKQADVSASALTISSSSQLVVPISDPQPGCWSVGVKVGKVLAREDPPPPPHVNTFTIEPSPKITSARRETERRLTVTGDNLIDAKTCDNQPMLTFRLVKSKDADPDNSPDLVPTSRSTASWTLRLPADFRQGTGFVKVLVNGKALPGAVQLK